MNVTREFSFEAAHMLSNYEGLCSNLHGHSYKLQVTMIGSPNMFPGEHSSNMVMDFSELKQIVQEEIIDQLDHAIIFSGAVHRAPAEERLLAWAVDNDMRHVVLSSRSTAENICNWIRVLLCSRLPGDVHVRLWETAKSFVEV